MNSATAATGSAHQPRANEHKSGCEHGSQQPVGHARSDERAHALRDRGLQEVGAHGGRRLDPE
jgi:hypothetical protein